MELARNIKISENKNLMLFFSEKELFKSDIELICSEFTLYFDGYDISDGFVFFHFGSIGERFQNAFKKEYNCKNKIEHLCTNELYTIQIFFDENNFEI